MTRIAVAGASGTIGSRILALAREYESLKITGAFEKKGHKDIGRDIGILCGTGEAGVILEDSISKVTDKSDVVIDFTHTSSTIENLKATSASKTAMVIGTTGFSKEELTEVTSLARTIPCVMASNMSLGVNLLLKVLRDVARTLGDADDIEVIEAHHRLKKDAPSGTALKIARFWLTR